MISAINGYSHSIRIRSIYPDRDVVWYLDLIAREVNRVAMRKFQEIVLERFFTS
jgi:hypothetical protein